MIPIKPYPRACKVDWPDQTPPSGQLQGRKILPLNSTSTVTGTSADRVVDGENSEIKVKNQLCTQYILTLIETILDTPFERGRTAFQGAHEKKGYQAAHGSFCPEPKDEFTKKLADRISTHGVTPKKTKPFLENRCALSSPDVKQLHEKHKDKDYVRKTLESSLPTGNGSSLTNTRFHWNCNATFGNPDESNQYDSRLEKKIAPFLKELQDQRMDGTLTPEESLERLVNWLSNYHTTGITNLKTQLENIDSLSTHFESMRTFELANLTVDLIPEDAFTSYLNDVNQFLICYDALTAKKTGCPSCAEFKLLRNDFSFLRKLQSMPFEQQLPFYLANRSHLSKEMHCDREALATKYRLYLDEANAQLAAVKDFEDPCVIPNLSKMLFGIMENGVRRAPTDEELRGQVFKLFALATPEKEKMTKRRQDEEDAKENIALSCDRNLKRRRLEF